MRLPLFARQWRESATTNGCLLALADSGRSERAMREEEFAKSVQVCLEESGEVASIGGVRGERQASSCKGFRILLIVGLVFLFDPSSEGNEQLQPRTLAGSAMQLADRQAAARRIATGYAAGNFRPSLEMKEAVDFLLTPAFLIQEAISGGVVPTYPSE